MMISCDAYAMSSVEFMYGYMQCNDFFHMYGCNANVFWLWKDVCMIYAYAHGCSVMQQMVMIWNVNAMIHMICFAGIDEDKYSVLCQKNV